jgi:hypothetical protein
MFPTLFSRSHRFTLDETISRLARHPVVDGVLLIGSTGQPALSPVSDYDMIVVLNEPPVPVHVALTRIEGRLTDVVFYEAAVIRRIAEGEALADSVDSLEGKLIRWLQTGKVAFDRTGHMEAAQRKAQTGISLRPAGEGEIYAAWFSVNYNVEQTRRMLASPEPVYQWAVDHRLLYQLADLWGVYFRVRRLPWEGEKAAIRYFQTHDPEYLDLFQTCLAAPDRARKVQLYEQLAAMTLAPLGGLWPGGSTAVQLAISADGGLPADAVQNALAFWEGLLAD